MINKEIPQRLWEDYVKYRDEMTAMEEKPIGDEKANEKWGFARQIVLTIESQYDVDYLHNRYDESLTKNKE